MDKLTHSVPLIKSGAAKAGIYMLAPVMDSRLRGNDNFVRADKTRFFAEFTLSPYCHVERSKTSQGDSSATPQNDSKRRAQNYKKFEGLRTLPPLIL